MKGRIVSHYKIIEELGAGGMGVVYRAEDTKLGRDVALKFISPRGVEGPEERARFLHEARAAASLGHPNICTIYEIDEAEGRLFMAMELVEGESLKDKIARGPLPIDEALDLALQIAQGLEAAHRKGVVHRDVKPANVMVAPEGLVKIMDFGLAKLSGRTMLTKEGTTLGTVAYMSPEQARGKEADRRSDLWSLGAILYEMVTGRLPFRGDYEQAVLYSIMNEAPEPMTALRSNVPMEIERIAAKALAKDPSERYQHADELAADLRALRKSLEAGAASRMAAAGATPRPGASFEAAAPAKPPKRRLAKILVPLCVAAAAVAAFVFLRPVLFGGAIATERHPVAVITFENQTGDPQYDNLKKVIPNLLITSLEQSKYLQVATWERLRDLAKQTGKRSVEEIDADLGFEICRREKIDALVIGSFTKLGDRFVIDIKVLDVDSKGSLAVANADGRGLESIPEQVDKLSKQISRGVGLSERKIAETQRPLVDVTTSSVEAYTYYLKGTDALERFYFGEAIRAFERAVEIDSTFAVAYLFLGEAYRGSFNETDALEAFKKAFSHSGKATERERLYIESGYAGRVNKDSDEEIRIGRELLEKYPREKLMCYTLGVTYRRRKMYREAVSYHERALELDPTFGISLNDLAYVHLAMENYDKALELFRRYSELCPSDGNPYDSMGEAYFRMGRLADAARMYERANALKPDIDSAVMLAYLCGMRGDFRGAIRWIESHMQAGIEPGKLISDYCWKAIYRSCSGQRGQALRDARRAFEIADSTGISNMLLVSKHIEGHVLYHWGRLEEARSVFEGDLGAERFSRIESPNDVAFRECYVGFIEVATGDLPAARTRLTRLLDLKSGVRSKEQERAKSMANRAAALKAEILLAEGLPRDAIRCGSKELEPYVPDSGPALFYAYVPFELDVVPRACAAKGDLDRAIAEYGKLLVFDPAGKERRILNPRYEYRIAKLLERQGKSAGALEHYRKFLEYYSEADPDIPELIDAAARVATIKPSRS